MRSSGSSVSSRRSTPSCAAMRDVTLAMAEASQARWPKGEPLGPLDGVPVTIKDNIGVAGWPMRRGSAVASDAPFAGGRAGHRAAAGGRHGLPRQDDDAGIWLEGRRRFPRSQG